MIVFLAGIGCGCLICCCSGCKSHHRIPAPIAMAKNFRHQPKNNVIVIRTDGDEVVPEVAEGFKNMHKMKRHHRRGIPAPQVQPEEPAVTEAPAEEAQQETQE